MSLFRNATFVLSAHELRDLPPPGAPEVAFAGRSNSGKSSAINTLAHHNRLAFVSKTPGRTQLINFFRLAGGGLLVDLPGYGYAKVPGATRQHWEKVLSGYLQTRESLRGMVLIMDVRHPLTSLDETMLAWFGPTGKPVHVLLTKADKLTRSRAEATLHSVRARLGELSPHFSVQLFSSLKRTGVDAAEAALGGWLRWEGAPGAVPESAGDNTKAPSRVHKALSHIKKEPRQGHEARGRNKKAPRQVH
ncbi:MAG: YihA family ribosome biogenesis GTP-binding protein, partial [Gammaproteobacteria bacterium]|nr:YihA family ribosome biogenesis GTP-binding protein [Gammaproteobacteria bacterium]